MSFTPRLEIYPKRIEANARSIIELCHSNGIKVACVTKVSCAHPRVVQALESAGADMLADSRLENLKAIKQTGTHLPLMLLRIPTPSRAEETVNYADISLTSSIESTRVLSAAAEKIEVNHQVILMVDVGDLREGIWPDRVMKTAKEITSLPNLELVGLGTNLACYGGVIPTTDKMQMLIDLRHECRSVTGLPLPILCGGNSANLPLLSSGGMPHEINLLRIGETILLGRNVIDRSAWPETRQDTFRLVAEVVELERKPSIPVGQRGQDAFGGTPQFVDRGIRQRAICNIGRQDIVVDNLEPQDSGMIILGGSSDHLIVDVEDSSSPIQPGTEIGFYPGYGALLAASTSHYVQKTVVEE